MTITRVNYNKSSKAQRLFQALLWKKTIRIMRYLDEHSECDTTELMFKLRIFHYSELLRILSVMQRANLITSRTVNPRGRKLYSLNHEEIKKVQRIAKGLSKGVTFVLHT